MIVLDTGGLYAPLAANEALHGRAVAVLARARPPRVLSPFVLAEPDDLVGNRVGHEAQVALADEVVRKVREPSAGTARRSESSDPSNEGHRSTYRAESGKCSDAPIK